MEVIFKRKDYTVNIPKDVAKSLGITKRKKIFMLRIGKEPVFGFIVNPRAEEGVKMDDIERNKDKSYSFLPTTWDLAYICHMMNITFNQDLTVKLIEKYTDEGMKYYLFEK